MDKLKPPLFHKKTLIIGAVCILAFYALLTGIGVLFGSPSIRADNDDTIPQVILPLHGVTASSSTDQKQNNHKADQSLSRDQSHDQTHVYEASNKPKIAIVIEDIGLSQTLNKALESLPPHMTLLMSPYAQIDNIDFLKSKHEFWLYIPIEGGSQAYDNKGSYALSLNQTTPANMANLTTILQENPHVMGVAMDYNNSAMGVFKTTLTAAANAIFEKKYRFLDMNSSAPSMIETIAHDGEYPYIRANPQDDIGAIKSHATQTGGAIYMVSPYMIDMNTLNQTINTLKRNGFEIAPLSALIPTHAPL